VIFNSHPHLIEGLMLLLAILIGCYRWLWKVATDGLSTNRILCRRVSVIW